jgi:hypothetical protein
MKFIVQVNFDAPPFSVRSNLAIGCCMVMAWDSPEVFECCWHSFGNRGTKVQFS